MRKIRNICGTFCVLTSIVSCSGDQAGKNNQTNQLIPEALQDNQIPIKRYSHSGDLTEELYQELVENTPALKKLEEELAAFNPKPDALKNTFNQYNNKSKRYYRSANNSAASIKDSLLRMKIISLIKANNERYAGKIAELNSIIAQIDKKETTLNDHHTVLKIVLTLPIIEKYQNDAKPDKAEFMKVIKEEDRLILKTDSLTPQ